MPLGLLGLGPIFGILQPDQHLSLLDQVSLFHADPGDFSHHLGRQLDLAMGHDIPGGVQNHCRALRPGLTARNHPEDLHLDFLAGEAGGGDGRAHCHNQHDSGKDPAGCPARGSLRGPPAALVDSQAVEFLLQVFP